MSAGRDAIVVGAGHNGLAAAALLARGGLRVLVLERAERVGGAAVTEEIHPGFRASTVAHTAGPLRASLVRELDLALEEVEPEVRVFAPRPGGGGVALYADPARSAESIRARSPRDAERFAAFHASLSAIGSLLSGALGRTPPDVDDPSARDLWSLARLAVGFRRLGRADAQRLLRWGPMAVADFAEEWFESEPLRALVAARGIRGVFAGPRSPGTTANLLLDAAAGGGAAGSCRFVRGGLGALSEALAAAARRRGAEIRTGAAVAAITAKDGRVSGVALASGEEIPARVVVSATDPRRTVVELVDPALLDPDDRRRFEHLRMDGMASKVNLALGGLPVFAGAEGDGALLRGRIHAGADLDTLERAYDAAKYGGFAERPWLDVTIPSLADPDLAPAGRHVLSACVQFTPYRLRDATWEERRDALGEAVIASFEELAPGLRSLVEAVQVLTPEDLERRYGLAGGHPSHGETSLDQLFVARPVLGFHRYRGPLPGLYLCSAGTHPGGGVTGAPGANAAREILRDLG